MIATSRYEVTGQIRAVGGDNGLNKETTTVVLRDTMAAAETRDMTAGDEVLLGGRTVATVQDVAAYATANPCEQTVFSEADLETHTQQGRQQFGNTQVRPGQSITLSAPKYTVDGRLEQIESSVQFKSKSIQQESLVVIYLGTLIIEADVVSVGA